MGNSIKRNEHQSVNDSKDTFGIGKERSELTVKLFNFRKISSWSLSSLSQRLNLSLPGSVRSSHSVYYSSRSKSKRYSSSFHRNSKTIWPTSYKDSLFLSHFKRFSRNSEFYIDNIISKGAFGIVFKVATKNDSDQVYALKVLKKSKIIEENAVQQIKDEIEIQRICSHHPFIVKFIDSWQNRGNLHILLEYISCGELFTKITKFPYELIRLYVGEIASAIDFLHNAGIIYRDVKPENILLTKSYHIKITDFGLSKWLKFGDQTRTMCGTLQYMAPEILIGSPYGHSVDWWALGVVACRMFTNKYPNTKKLVEEKHALSSSSQDQIIMLDHEDENTSTFLPNEINAIQKEGKDLLLRLLEYDPKMRIKSVIGLQRIAMYKDFKIDTKLLLKISPLEIMKSHNISPDAHHIGDDAVDEAQNIFEGF